MKTEFEQTDIHAIASAVAEIIKPLRARNIKQESVDAILDAQGLADYLQLDISWIHRQVQLKTIPYFKAGKYLRFRKSAIDKWIDKETINPLSSLPYGQKRYG